MPRLVKKASNFKKLDFFNPANVPFSEPLMISVMAFSICEDIRNHISHAEVRENLNDIKNVYGKEINVKVRQAIIDHLAEKSISHNVAAIHTVLGMHNIRSKSTDLFDESQLTKMRSMLFV